MKILDWYIVRKYLMTFVVMLFMFIPISIMVHISEKVDKYKEKDVPMDEILWFYLDYTVYLGYQLYPLFLFLSVIWFTSKLANIPR